jgi:hypothetical protein
LYWRRRRENASALAVSVVRTATLGVGVGVGVGVVVGRAWAIAVLIGHLRFQATCHAVAGGDTDVLFRSPHPSGG